MQIDLTCVVSFVDFGCGRIGDRNRDSVLYITVEPRLNEVPRDRGSWFVISRFYDIHFTGTLARLKLEYRSLYRGFVI